jgi:inward rectifier potassium channel
VKKNVIVRRIQPKIIRPNGTLNFKVKGLSFLKTIEIHNLLLSISWFGFVSIIFFIYLITNTIFTILYLLSGATGLSGIHASSGNIFSKVFYFSAQTLCTGYFTDTIPVSIRSTSLAAVEAVVGLFLFALITGLLYSRFSKPNSKIIFSDKILIGSYKQGKALMVRIANIKRNQLLKVSAEVILLLRIEVDGVLKNMFYNLKLEQETIGMLLLTWTIIHPIDEGSPLDTFSIEDIIAANGEIIVVIEGSDDILSQNVFARTSFAASDIIPDGSFEDITYTDHNNILTIDISKMNQYNGTA